MLEFIALGMVLDAPLTGYDIKKRIETGVGVFYKASYGSLYPLLKKLAEQGLLTVAEQPQGGRVKKLYRITPRGNAAFFEWLRAPIEFSGSADSQLAKIYFFDRLPAGERAAQLAGYEASCTRYLEMLRALLKKYEAMENKACFYYKLSTLYYGIAVMQATLAWCGGVKAGADFSQVL